ncbi:MAG: M24 family metallopeptidase [Candidatus Levyibacteriota bacterium]
MKSLIKEKKEISSIMKACKVCDAAFKYILPHLKTGVSEKETAFKINKFIRNKSEGIAFKTIVAFGENSSEIHHRPNNRELKKGDIIMFDFGAKINGYCSDISRTVFFKKITLRKKHIYDTVLKAQEKAIIYLNSSLKRKKLISGCDLDKIARNYISQKYPNFPHSLGHGIGKKVQMSPKISPKSKTILKPGMIFSIEPGIYIKNFGGVRIEDLVLLTKNGVKMLTNSSREIIKI